MAGPFIPQRAGQPLDLIEQAAGADGWESLEELMRPHLARAPLQPEDTVAEFMFGLYQTPQGRAMFEWLMDITLRQPLRATGRTFEETALLTATRQGVNGVAEAVLAAIAHGERLVEQRNSQNGAGR